jgi:hypothetical protein
MAGPDATFGWWGDLTHGSLFLTAYAYYADWNALRVMGLEAPPNHWEKLLDIYKKQGDGEDLLHKAVILWLAKEMGLPTRTLWEGAADQAVKSEVEPGREKAPSPPGAANLMEPSPTSDFRDMALVLLDLTAEPSAPKAELHAPAAMERLAGSKHLLAQALLLMAVPPSQAGRGDQARAAEILGSLGPETATIDRAVALLFVHKALSTKGGVNAADLFNPGDAWTKRPSLLDTPVWHWQGRSGQDVTIELKAPPAKPVQANLAYETTTEEESRLPVRIERRLYRLQSEPIDKDHPPTDEDGVPLQALYKAVQVENPARIDTGELYLDVIAISPPENTVYKYGVVDVALPPGADTEPMPWGVVIAGVEEGPEGRSYPGFQSYSVPIDELKEPMVFRQLVRFSQRGSFNMPPARFFRMYQPEEKAFEPGAYVGRIEVR